MAFAHSVLAMISILVLPIAGIAAINMARNGDGALAMKTGAVACIAAMIWITAPKNETRLSDNCWIDWDARSNATVCD